MITTATNLHIIHLGALIDTVQAQFVIQAVMDTIAQTFLSSIL